MEEYPIVKNGARIGTLRVQRARMTEFYAELPDEGELLRLSVYGQGREGRLGLMMPEDGRLVLRRRLSRAAMRDFPGEIDFAGPQGQLLQPPAVQETQPAPQEQLALITESEPTEEDLLWFSAPDGTLSAFDGRRVLLAIPAELGAPRGVSFERRSIEGREYVVFSRGK